MVRMQETSTCFILLSKSDANHESSLKHSEEDNEAEQRRNSEPVPYSPSKKVSFEVSNSKANGDSNSLLKPKR